MMKTTLKIPDSLFRRAKSAAAGEGIPQRELVSDALAERLVAPGRQDKPWMRSFGKLRRLRETAKINRIIEEEFGGINPSVRTVP